MALKKWLYRQSLASSAQAIQPSGQISTSADNWGGASATLAELSKHLDESIQNFDLDSIDEDRVGIQERLKSRAEQYGNCTLHDRSLVEWNCTRAESDQISIAAACSKAVYGACEVPEVPGYACRLVGETRPSRSGTTKATSFYAVNHASFGSANSTADYPFLVVSVRGSASFVDWVVNASGHAIDAFPVINSAALHNATCGGRSIGPLLRTHRGFLNSARELLPDIVLRLQGFIEENPFMRILFTGHSAGGAVAQILFAHFIAADPGKYTFLDLCTVSFSCVTFGAPPAFNQNITQDLKSIPSRFGSEGVFLAFVTEGDPIARADMEYCVFLLKLYNSTNPSDLGGSAIADPEYSFQQRVRSAFRHTLKPPESTLQAGGDLVLLRDENSSSQGLDLKAYLISERDLSGLLFCNFFVHKMDLYLRLSSEIAGSNFNRRTR